MSNEIRDNLQDLGHLLKEAYGFISKERGNIQSVADALSGHMRTPSGIVVPLSIHRFVYNNYDIFILRAFYQLFQHMLRAEDDVFISMTFRVIQELGIKKIDIFFANSLSGEENKKARLISVLSDWILIGKTYRNHFNTLLSEEHDVLDNSGQKIFDEISLHFNSSLSRIPKSLLKQMNRYRESILGLYSKKIPILNFIKGPDLDALLSFWSEMLHGNPFMLEQIFNKELVWRNKNRLYAILWFTGQHVLRRIKPFVEDLVLKEKIEAMCDDADPVWQQLTNEWKAESKQRT